MVKGIRALFSFPREINTFLYEERRSDIYDQNN